MKEFAFPEAVPNQSDTVKRDKQIKAESSKGFHGFGMNSKSKACSVSKEV